MWEMEWPPLEAHINLHIFNYVEFKVQSINHYIKDMIRQLLQKSS